ncbi:hypothetical protein DC993_25195, partial [Escherichia coli]|nr:hypothetical protein [Escherichia coli]
NPLLGAKVLPGETDIALPGPLPFILSRTYSSYRTKTPAPVGSLGPGWKMPADTDRAGGPLRAHTDVPPRSRR